MRLLKLTTWLGLACFLTIPVAAQDLHALASQADTDLKTALSELATLRQQIEGERLPLARRLSEIEAQLAEAKNQLARAQRSQENQLVELNALKAQAKAKADEVAYIDSLLGEYARTFRSRLNFAEEARFADPLDAVDKAAVSPDMTPAEIFARRSMLLDASLQRLQGALGGEIFPGQALDAQGRVHAGKVALLGPVAMFASDSGDLAGVLQMELNKSDPTVVPADKDLMDSARALVMTGKGQVALDATGGNAFKLAAMHENLVERLAKGGLVMAPLLTMGLAVLVVSLLKWIQFVRIRLTTEKDLQTVLGHLEEDAPTKALTYARSITGPAGNLLATAVEHADEKKEYIEEIMYEKILGARTRLERGIPFLALTATAGPLMGLLGTVMGMIATFRLISSFGSGDPKLLAAGISEALIATATGMAVAIPALLLHAFLSRKAKTIIGSMEQTAVGFINGIPETERSTFA